MEDTKSFEEAMKDFTVKWTNAGGTHSWDVVEELTALMATYFPHWSPKESAVQNKKELERKLYEARYAKYKGMVAEYPDCENGCGHSVMSWEDSNRIYIATKIRPSYCNGFAYLQTDGYAEEINGDHSLYMLCDGENHNGMMDI